MELEFGVCFWLLHYSQHWQLHRQTALAAIWRFLYLVTTIIAGHGSSLGLFLLFLLFCGESGVLCALFTKIPRNRSFHCLFALDYL